MFVESFVMHRCFRSACAAIAFVLAPVAFASGPLCVNNATDLFNDLKAYSDGGASAHQTLTIHLVRGITYTVGGATSNGPFAFNTTSGTGALTISGGWNSTCTQQSLDASLTILDGNGISQVLQINNENGSTSISRVTIQHGNYFFNVGLSVNSSTDHGGSVDLVDSIIQNNQSTGSNGGIAIYSIYNGTAVHITVANNLIINNSSVTGYSAGYISGTSVASLYVANNTVYNNTAPGNVVGGLAVGGSLPMSEHPEIYANIFSQNSNMDLDLTSASSVGFNDYGTIGGISPSSSFNNSTAAPGFVNAAGGNFHLSQASPLIGIIPGLGFCYASDLEGHTRTSTSYCEAGVYAETIFGNSFEATE
jgi:hypothetical protein